MSMPIFLNIAIFATSNIWCRRKRNLPESAYLPVFIAHQQNVLRLQLYMIQSRDIENYGGTSISCTLAYPVLVHYIADVVMFHFHLTCTTRLILNSWCLTIVSIFSGLRWPQRPHLLRGVWWPWTPWPWCCASCPWRPSHEAVLHFETEKWRERSLEG